MLRKVIHYAGRVSANTRPHQLRWGDQEMETAISWQFNPLPTDDAFWCRQILATCYQLAQPILKIGSALAERVGQGEVGGYTALPDSTWWQLQLPVEKPWSMTVGHLSAFLH